MSDKSIELWISKSNKKSPKLINESKGVYEIVFKNNGKVSIGIVNDGMHTRYGIDTIFSMSDGSAMSIWQKNIGTITNEKIQIMIDYYHSRSKLLDFDFNNIKNIRN